MIMASLPHLKNITIKICETLIFTIYNHIFLNLINLTISTPQTDENNSKK